MVADVLVSVLLLGSFLLVLIAASAAAFSARIVAAAAASWASFASDTALSTVASLTTLAT